jgi:acyl carrier protein
VAPHDDRQQVETFVVNLLVQDFDQDPGKVDTAASMESLGLDSLDMVEIAQVVEEHYGVRIEGDDIADLHVLGDVVDLIIAKSMATGWPSAKLSP